MSDKILILLLAVCLCFGGYKLISNKLAAPEESDVPLAQQSVEARATSTTNAAPTEEVSTQIAEAPPSLPPKLSQTEFIRLFRVDGIAQGQQGDIVMINNKALHEGDRLDELLIQKITADHIDVLYKDHTYQLSAHPFKM